jgi:hypothetical protein
MVARMMQKIMLLALLALTLVIPGAQAQFPGYPPVNAVQIGHGSTQPPGWDTILGTMAPQNSNAVVITGGTITGMPAPLVAADVANKQYVDQAAAGLFPHASANVATIAALPTNTYANGTAGVGATLTANANGALTVDSVAVAINNRVLVKNEATAANNGIYTVTATGSAGAPYVLTRATDANTIGTGANAITAGTYVWVTQGTTLFNTAWVQTQSLSAIGTSAINWTLFSASSVSSLNGIAGPVTIQGATGNVTTTTVTTATPNVTVSAATVIPFYLGGCTMANDPGATNAFYTVLDINACAVADSTNAAMGTAAAFTKTTTGPWVAGSGNAGMGATLTVAANKWYHVCFALNSGTPDYWFDVDAICDHKPSSITDPKFRRIGSFKTDSSAHIHLFRQTGDTFWYSWGATVGSFGYGGNSFSVVSVIATDTPLGISVRPILNANILVESGVGGQITGNMYVFDSINDLAKQQSETYYMWSFNTYAGPSGITYENPNTANTIGPPTDPNTGYLGYYFATSCGGTCTLSYYLGYMYLAGYIDERGKSN